MAKAEVITCDPKIPAFSCEDGILSIGSLQAQIRIRWRPSPLAEHMIPGSSKWTPFWPAFRLLRPKKESVATPAIGELVVPVGLNEQVGAKEMAFQAFRNEIPEAMADLVAPFRSHQWQLLCMMHSAPSAMDLAKVNPVLGYCLANNLEFRNTKPEAAAVQAIWYSHRKQKVILEWLGFKTSESLVRLFRKIPPDSVYPSLMRRLRSMLEWDKNYLFLLVHLPRISRGVLELVTNQATVELAAAKLLHEVAERTDELSVEQTSDILLGSLQLRREMGIGEVLRPFTSVAQVVRFQEKTDAEYRIFQVRQEEDRLAAERAAAETSRLKKAARRELLSRPFPAPPVPGTGSIIPLVSAAELKQEGRNQRNCVATYVDKVLGGQTYIYKVLAPERATLSVVWASDGCWRRSELKSAGNHSVSVETINAVERWLRQYRLSI